MPKILKSVKFKSQDSFSVGTKRVFHDPSAPSEHSQAVAATAPDQDPTAESANLLAEAQSHVEMMLNQAQTKMESWKEEAHKAGWEAGYAAGKEAVETELTDSLATAQQVVQSAVEKKEQYLSDSRVEIGKLAVTIAEKIIGRELTLNSKAITDIVAQAIEMADVKGACCIRVNPKDYEILSPLWEAIPSFQGPQNRWELAADKGISPNGCLIEVDGGVVDARLKTQLAQISEVFEHLEGV